MMRTLKWILMIVVSVGVGTFIDVNILEKVDLSIWLSRGIGCLITVVIALILYHCLLKEKSSK